METADRIVRIEWGKRVKDARKGLGLTQVAAAERCRCDQSTLSRIESGDYPAMTPELILRLCVGLGMEASAFDWPTAIREIAEMRDGTAA